jgi:Tol biopolymer transport system component
MELCRGFAYSTLQIASDGGALLTAGPMQGWSNLYVLEPDGTSSSLVRNALNVSGDFIPGTDYIVVVVTKTGRDGKELYVYDRKKMTMTLLYEGPVIKYRVFPDGNLMVERTQSDSFGFLRYFGPAGNGELPELQLPEGRDSSEITADGNHLLYVTYEGDASRLVLANMDGTGEKEIMSGDISYGEKFFSPDGTLLLIQEEGADYTNKVSLFDIAAGTSLPITPDSNQLEYGFSPDGKWAVAVSTFNREEGDTATTQKETLYLFNVQDKKVAGEIVNYYFSPDGTHLSYTMKNEDETLTIVIINLADLSEKQIGEGLLTGWSLTQ